MIALSPPHVVHRPECFVFRGSSHHSLIRSCMPIVSDALFSDTMMASKGEDTSPRTRWRAREEASSARLHQEQNTLRADMEAFLSDPSEKMQKKITAGMASMMKLAAELKKAAEKKLAEAEQAAMAASAETNSVEDDTDATAAMSEQQSLIDAVPGNRLCADCRSPNPQCVSVSLGVALCVECSRVHRGLGVHISKVCSWTVEILDKSSMEVVLGIGNAKANNVWEATMHPSLKPQPDAGWDAKDEVPSFPCHPATFSYSSTCATTELTLLCATPVYNRQVH